MKTLQLFTLIILCVTFSCQDDDPEISASCLPGYEADPPGQWYVGDFHVHATGGSNDTGGDSTPEAIKETAINRGLDFLVITDHSNSTGSDASTTEEDPALFNMGPEFTFWDEAAALSTSEFLMIDGNEISPRSDTDMLPTGHIGCIPIDLETTDLVTPFIDRPMGTVTGASAIQQAKEHGCFAILNHPYSPLPWIAFDWTSYDYDAMEIWNGTLGFDIFDEHAYNIWRCDLLNGKNTIAVGGSDNHRVFIEAPGTPLDPALGFPSTAIYSEELSWTALMRNLQLGKTIIFEGESRVQINAYDALGCRANPTQMRTIRLRGKADPALPSPVLKLTRAIGCSDPRPDFNFYPVMEEEILFEESITPGEAFDIAVELTPNSGVYTAILKGNSTHYAAISQSIVVE